MKDVAVNAFTITQSQSQWWLYLYSAPYNIGQRRWTRKNLIELNKNVKWSGATLRLAVNDDFRMQKVDFAGQCGGVAIESRPNVPGAEKINVIKISKTKRQRPWLLLSHRLPCVVVGIA